MADDSTYYLDVIRWLKAHPEQTPAGYLEPAGATPNTRCADRAHCLQTSLDGAELTPQCYVSDRAMRESGFDTSSRFGPFSGSTEDYAPICLNSLLYKYERDMAHFATLLGRPEEATQWERRATARQTAINKYLWNPTKGMFFDYDFTTHQPSTYN